MKRTLPMIIVCLFAFVPDVSAKYRPPARFGFSAGAVIYGSGKNEMDMFTKSSSSVSSSERSADYSESFNISVGAWYLHPVGERALFGPFLQFSPMFEVDYGEGGEDFSSSFDIGGLFNYILTPHKPTEVVFQIKAGLSAHIPKDKVLERLEDCDNSTGMKLGAQGGAGLGFAHKIGKQLRFRGDFWFTYYWAQFANESTCGGIGSGSYTEYIHGGRLMVMLGLEWLTGDARRRGPAFR